jgi:SOS-response transcriptional repressor LexA
VIELHPKMIERQQARPLSRRQAENLDIIETFIAQSGYCPTYRELCDLSGISRNAMYQQVRALTMKCRLERFSDRQIIVHKPLTFREREFHGLPKRYETCPRCGTSIPEKPRAGVIKTVYE